MATEAGPREQTDTRGGVILQSTEEDARAEPGSLVMLCRALDL